MSYCSVFGCKNGRRNTAGKEGIKFFRFPRDENFAKRWTFLCKRPDEMNVKTARICSVHFDEDSYYKSLQEKLLRYSPINVRKLKKDALPTLNLPTSSGIKNTEREDRVKEKSKKKSLVRELFQQANQPGRKDFVDVNNMDIVKVEPDEEEPVKGWLPTVKPEPQDPLDVNDERREPWSCTLNVTDSSSIHTDTKNEDASWKASIVKEEINEEMTIEDHDVKQSGDSDVLEDNDIASPQSNEGESEEEYSYLKLIRSIRCKYCYKVFNEGYELEEHLFTHSRDKPFKCEVCSKEFSQRGSLARHVRIHTGEKPFTCDYCGKSFTEQSYLIRHIRIHTGEKPYKCEHCGRCFNQRSTLTKHTFSHTKEKSFKCSSCELRFTNRHDLYRHAPTHTEGKPFKCEVCGKDFNLRAFLVRHLRTHTLKKTMKCDFCDRHFKQLAHLRNHLRTHTGMRKYSCEYCGKNYKEKGHLIAHRKLHKGEIPVGAEIVSRTNVVVIVT